MKTLKLQIDIIKDLEKQMYSRKYKKWLQCENSQSIMFTETHAIYIINKKDNYINLERVENCNFSKVVQTNDDYMEVNNIYMVDNGKITIIENEYSSERLNSDYLKYFENPTYKISKKKYNIVECYENNILVGLILPIK